LSKSNLVSVGEVRKQLVDFFLSAKAMNLIFLTFGVVEFPLHILTVVAPDFTRS